MVERRRFRGALALLPEDASHAEFLENYARGQDAGPDVVLVAREALARRAQDARFRESVHRDLEGVAGRDLTDPQLRAAGLFARLAPEDPLWGTLAVPVARKLVLENPLRIDDWREVFQPVSSHLMGPLLAILADASQAERHKLAFTLLFEFVDQPLNPTRPEDLASLLPEAAPDLAEQIFARLPGPSDRARAAAHLVPMLEPLARFDGKRAERQGRVALALIRLGETGPVLPLFAHRDDPSVRTELILGAFRHGVDPAWVIERLRHEANASARRAWLLCLGGYPLASVPEPERRSLAKLLMESYRSDPDPGVHGAVDWLLRRVLGRRKRARGAGSLA